VGVGRPRRVPRWKRPIRPNGYHDRAAPSRRRRRPAQRYRLRASSRKYSDHISLPILMLPRPRAKTKPRSTRLPRCGHGQERAHGAGLQGLLKHVAADSPTRWPGCTARSRHLRVHVLLFIPSARPSTCTCAGRPGVKLHISGSSSWRTRASGCRIPAVRPRRDRSADSAERFPRAAPGSRVVDNIRANATKKVLRAAGRHREKEPEKYAAFWKEFAPSKEAWPRLRQPGRDRQLLRFTPPMSASDEPDSRWPSTDKSNKIVKSE